jgi:enoyl-CoA hydratase/carnithine racemase
MADRILRHVEGGVCTLTLNRPEKLNALDLAAFEALDERIEAIGADDGIGCVVIRGAGKGFSAGADLAAMGDDAGKPPTYKQHVIGRLARLRQPVVAAIHGVCFTGGLELALACDFLVADESARFADTHGKWGFVGTWGISQRLPRRIGVARAKRMMMTSRIVDAREAERIGLIDALAPAGGLDDTLDAFVGEIVANSWHTNMSVKRFLIDTDGLSLAESLAHEHYHYPGLAPDYRERVAAFTKKD